MVRALRVSVMIVAIAMGAAFFGSFAGAWHPLGDSLAVFRIPLAVVFALLVIWSPWPAPLRWGLAVLCIAAIAQIVAQKYVTHPAGPIVIYQKNLLFENNAVEALEADIRAAAPDIIALQEVTSRNAPLLRALRDTHPYQASCALTDWARVAILSRWPSEGEICLENQGLVGLQVETEQGTFWAISLHAFWPWPHGQAAQLDRVMPALQALEDPVVISGDFNMVPWSRALRRVAALTQTTRAGPLFPTLIKSGAPLPIDHVFAPGGGQASPRDRLGSDHNGVLARVFVFD